MNKNDHAEQHLKRMDRFSIKWKLFAYLVFFITIPIAVIWFFQIIFLEFYTNVQTNSVKTTAETIVNNMDNDNVGMLIKSMAQQNGYNITLYDADGSPQIVALYGPGDKLSTLTPGRFAELYREAAENGGYSFELFDEKPADLTGQNFIGQASPKTQYAGKTAISVNIVGTQDGAKVLVLHASLTPVSGTVNTLRVQVVYITMTLLVLCLIIALIMARHISQPIIETNVSAKELAKGDFGAKFDAHGYREIVELNNTLNYTASELSKVEKLRQELIANVSHDLRTPLTLITGYAEMLRDIPDENTPENVQIIIEEARRLSGLVSDMLDISRIQSGTQQLNRSTYDLTESLREIMGRYAKLVEQDGYEISFFAGEDVDVNADPVRIAQVAYNLINNAVNYTGDDKKVTVRQTVRGGTVRVEVEDTGAGIAAAEIPYIWDRYYRADKTHKRAAIGTGLGLSIVRGILDMHGAKYGVESTPGAGSTFWFELPRAD